MQLTVCASRGLQKARMRLGEFFLEHGQLLLIVLLFIVAAQPLAFRLLRLVIRHLI